MMNGNTVTERRVDLASLFCMIGRHGPAVALAVVAVVSVLAGLVIYRTVRGKRRKAAAAAAAAAVAANADGGAEGDVPVIQESTDVNDEGSSDVKEDVDLIRSDHGVRHRRAAAEKASAPDLPAENDIRAPEVDPSASDGMEGDSCRAAESYANEMVLAGAVDCRRCESEDTIKDALVEVRESCLREPEQTDSEKAKQGEEVSTTECQDAEGGTLEKDVIEETPRQEDNFQPLSVSGLNENDLDGEEDNLDKPSAVKLDVTSEQFNEHDLEIEQKEGNGDVACNKEQSGLSVAVSSAPNRLSPPVTADHDDGGLSGSSLTAECGDLSLDCQQPQTDDTAPSLDEGTDSAILGPKMESHGIENQPDCITNGPAVTDQGNYPHVQSSYQDQQNIQTERGQDADTDTAAIVPLEIITDLCCPDLESICEDKPIDLVEQETGIDSAAAGNKTSFTALVMSEVPGPDPQSFTLDPQGDQTKDYSDDLNPAPDMQPPICQNDTPFELRAIDKSHAAVGKESGFSSLAVSPDAINQYDVMVAEGGTLEKDVIEETPRQEDNFQPLSVSGLNENDLDGEEDHLDERSAVKLDATSVQFNEHDLKLEQREENSLTCDQEFAVLYNGANQAEDKMPCDGSDIACNKEQDGLSVAVSSAPNRLSPPVTADQDDSGLSGSSVMAECADLSLDCQQPQKDDMAPSLDEGTDSAILGPQMESHGIENQPDCITNGPAVTDQVNYPHVQSSYQDQQNIQTERGQDADTDTAAIVPLEIITDLCCPDLESICEDKPIDLVEQETGIDSAAAGNKTSFTALVMSDVSGPDPQSFTLDPQGDQTKDYSADSTPAPDMQPPFCQNDTPFELRDIDKSHAAIGKESGFSSLAVSPDAFNEYDVMVTEGGTLEKDVIEETPRQEDNFQPLSISGLNENDLDGEEDNLDQPSAVKLDATSVQFNEHDLELEQKEGKSLTCDQEFAVLYNGANQAEDKMPCDGSDIACNKEQDGLSVAVSSAPNRLSPPVTADQDDGGLSGSSVTAECGDLSLDCQQPQKDDTTPSLDEGTDSAILGPQMESHGIKNQPDCITNGPAVTDQGNYPHVQSSYQDQQNIQTERGQDADTDTAAIVPLEIITDMCCPDLESICEDKPIDLVEQETGIDSAAAGNKTSCTALVMSEVPGPHPQSFTLDPQGDQTKDYSDDSTPAPDMQPPFCQNDTPFESGFSSLAVSPDAFNEYDVMVENVMVSEEQTQSQYGLYADDAAVEEETPAMLLGPDPSHCYQPAIGECEASTLNESILSQDDSFGQDIEESYCSAIDKFAAQIAESVTCFTKKPPGLKAAVESKEKMTGEKVDMKGAIKDDDDDEDDYEKTEISIMEATMDHNEWIMDNNYQAFPWMTLTVPSSAHDDTKTYQLPSDGFQLASAVVDTTCTDASDIPPSAEVQPAVTLSLIDNAENIRNVEAAQNVDVTFSIHYITQSPNQTVAVTGDRWELGNWKGFVPLEGAEDGHWATVVRLPSESHVEWKFVVVEKGQVCRWEECCNRLLDTGCRDQMLVHECWARL